MKEKLIFTVDIIGSNDTQEYYWLGCVDVRDVANAHVLLFEMPSASGRYLCTNGIHQFRDFAKTVTNLCPDYPIHRYFFIKLYSFLFL